MSRDWRLYVQDIAASCAKIARYTAGLRRTEFFGDDKTVDAVIRNLEVIGEAAKNVPENARQQMSGVEWRKIAGLRDVLVHAYFGIDDDILWEVVQQKVPELAAAVSRFLSDS